jgi:hypothetical protein
LYLLLIAARIGWGLVVSIFALPAGLVLFAIFSFAASANIALAIALGLAFGLPLLLIFIFLEALFQVFESSAWTEGYLALLAGTQPVLAPAPVPAA